MRDERGKPLDRCTYTRYCSYMTSTETTTAALAATTDREVTMSHTTSTTQVRCPELVCAGCGGQAVTAHYGRKSVTVEPCDSLRAQGWSGNVQVAFTHSQAIARLVVA